MQENAAETFDRLRLMGLNAQGRYRVSTLPQKQTLRRFGGLIRHALPVAVNQNGCLFSLLNRFKAVNDCVETYTGSGTALMHGILLNDQFIGTGYSERIRLLGDFGSNLYAVEEATAEKTAVKA
jgi:alpha-galactosidase